MDEDAFVVEGGWSKGESVCHVQARHPTHDFRYPRIGRPVLVPTQQLSSNPVAVAAVPRLVDLVVGVSVWPVGKLMVQVILWWVKGLVIFLT